MYAVERAYLKEGIKQCWCCKKYIEEITYKVAMLRKKNYYFHSRCYNLAPLIYNITSLKELIETFA